MMFGGFLPLHDIAFVGDYSFLLLLTGLIVGFFGLLQKD